MSLASQVTALAARIAVEIKTVIRPRLLPNGGTAGQTLIKSTADDYAVAWAAASGGSFNIQTFDANGTWTKPTNALLVHPFVQAGGAGGVSGARRASGTVSLGGVGGGSGGFNWDDLLAADLPATVPITVGNGGAGGASVTTDNTAGTNGANGGASRFGALTSAYCVSADGGNSSLGNHGGGRYALTFIAGASPATGGSAPLNASTVGYGVAPAGAGAGQTTTPGNYNGGAWWFSTRPSTSEFIGARGMGATKTDAISPTTPFALCYGLFGNGAPGGWSNADGTAGPGANGSRGGGGGGGGAALNGNPSGKGGDGAKGRIAVVTQCQP